MKKKLKTKKALAKRVKITKRGKILRRKGGKSHLLSGKSSKRKRSLRKATLVSKGHLKKVKRSLPYG
ncbi:MAG: 50S ribosomal protein L35 [Candidatus Omnitrophica bacterium]|nr:50S ribosomal protein L35 [Candidatus Omnitrophota bacterium]